MFSSQLFLVSVSLKTSQVDTCLPRLLGSFRSIQVLTKDARVPLTGWDVPSSREEQVVQAASTICTSQAFADWGRLSFSWVEICAWSEVKWSLLHLCKYNMFFSRIHGCHINDNRNFWSNIAPIKFRIWPFYFWTTDDFNNSSVLDSIMFNLNFMPAMPRSVTLGFLVRYCQNLW